MGTNLQCSSILPGEWVKGKVVGSGSFGTVHLALSKSTGSLFVVKSAESAVGMEFLENEAIILESLNSPYIVQCLGKETSHIQNGEKKLNIFMEYMAGGSLSDIAEKFGGVLDEQLIRLYTQEILKGLKYLHGNGIVHCDIKCKNVLLGSSGNVKLADFGCARRVDGPKNSDANLANVWKSIAGTPLWMAPEVLRNERLDFASDIWSLGCTVIEMATGKAPWSDEVSTPMSAVLKIASGDKTPRFPFHFSEEGLDFLSKCFERNPEKRWNAGDLLNHPFLSKKFTEVTSKTELNSHSPASILDDGIFEAYKSDDSDCCYSGNELQSRMAAHLMRCGGDGHRWAEMQQHERLELVSSQKWVTVR